jgi:hypothetical protein
MRDLGGAISSYLPMTPLSLKTLIIKNTEEMSKVNISNWKIIIKIIVAIASALLGVLGSQEINDAN